MNLSVDLNADLGEGAGSDVELLELVSSASIACGFHAGDPTMMRKAIVAAVSSGVSIGAHPSLADRENFGRTEIPVPPDEVFAAVVYQVGAFSALALAAGSRCVHVKPHGALYNMAARDAGLADAIVRAVAAVDRSLILYAAGRSQLAAAAQEAGIALAREAFADRGYMANGALVPRSHAGALLHDPAIAATRVMRMLREGVVTSIDGSDVPIQVDTICVHGDTPDTVEFARQLRSCLTANGVQISPPEVRR